MPKSSINAVALVAFLAGALSPAADAFVPQQQIRAAARSAKATCESVNLSPITYSNSCGKAAFLQWSWICFMYFFPLLTSILCRPKFYVCSLHVDNRERDCWH